MCDCNEKKVCCDCLKGGCECLCICACHTGDENDTCYAFPTLSCIECITRRTAAKALSTAMDTIDPKLLPNDEEVKRLVDRLPL